MHAPNGQTAPDFWTVAQSVSSCTPCILAAFMSSIANGLPAALSALIVGLQPLLTSTIANRLLGEQVITRQWAGLLLGIAGVYFVVQDKATTGGVTPLAWIASLVALLSITFGTIYQKRFG